MANHQRNRILHRRHPKGSGLSEFMAALVLLVVFVLIPLLDFLILPVRWMLAQEILDNYTRSLAISETRSEAEELMEADPSLRARLNRLGGVRVEDLDLKLKITRIFNFPLPEESIVLSMSDKIPADWLPNGSKAPCNYTIDLEASSMIEPAILIPTGALKIIGISAPVPVRLASSRCWENLGKNPASSRFYLEE